MSTLKLRSGALQFTVFIAVLIALLLSGLILYAYTFNYFKEQSKATVNIIQLAETGINYILNQEIGQDTTELENLEFNNTKVKTHLTNWGCFKKATAIASHRKKVFTKIALLGGFNDAETTPTLYLQESYNPLTVVGNTKLKGNIFLPSQGVKSGYIAGESYYGTQLIYGKSEKSGLDLPLLNGQTIEEINSYFNEFQPEKREDIVEFPAKSLTNSFKKSTKHIVSTEAITLNNLKLIGNIIVKSDKKITIAKATILKDILLIAPEIVIEDEVTGTFQAIATRSIYMGEKCQLNYPSALLLWDYSKIELSLKLQDKIIIDEGSQINGFVGYYTPIKEISNFNPRIVLEKEARIKGQVYCKGAFELKGTVSGSVYAKEFVANQAGSTFVNHIYNGIIENETIPQKYGGAIFQDNPKAVMKWLY